MSRLSLFIGLATVVIACDRSGGVRIPSPTQPSTVASPAPHPIPTVPARRITIGEDVRDTFRGTSLAFEFTAPTTGRLVARLTWDVWFNGSLLSLGLGNSQIRPQPPDWSPITGAWRVEVGETYRLTIGGAGTDWFYDDPFVLTTLIE